MPAVKQIESVRLGLQRNIKQLHAVRQEIFDTFPVLIGNDLTAEIFDAIVILTQAVETIIVSDFREEPHDLTGGSPQ